MTQDTFTLDVEYTDTFAGEANYCWVKRYELELPTKLSDRAIMQRIKKVAGLSGERGRSYCHGDRWEFRPYCSCTVLFASVRY